MLEKSLAKLIAFFNKSQMKSQVLTKRETEVRAMLKGLFHNARNCLTGHRVVLFGSRARGEARPRSDFDVGVIGDTSLPLEDFYALEDLIDSLPTLYRIDWVDLARVDEKFRRSALSEIEVIYEV